MHISVIGDSLTKGVILSEGKYQELEEGFVNIVSREKGLALKNFSKFGSTVRYGHSVLTRHSAEISESEYTIIEFGGNDSDFIWDVVASEPYTRHQSRTPEDEYYELYADLIHKVRDLGSEPIMLSLAPIIGMRYFSFVTRRMTDERKSNVYKWLGYDSEAMYRWHEHYNEATFQIAKMTDTPIIDITSSLDRCVGGKEQYYCIGHANLHIILMMHLGQQPRMNLSIMPYAHALLSKWWRTCQNLTTMMKYTKPLRISGRTIRQRRIFCGMRRNINQYASDMLKS